MSVTTAMSESPSIHSAKLVSLARSLSGLGFDAANGCPINLPNTDEPPLPVWSPLNVNTLTSCSDMSALFQHIFPCLELTRLIVMLLHQSIL